MPEGSSSRTYITDYRVPLSVCGDWSGAGVGGRGGEKCVLTTPTMISLCSRRESHRYLPDGGGAGRGGGEGACAIQKTVVPFFGISYLSSGFLI